TCTGRLSGSVRRLSSPSPIPTSGRGSWSSPGSSTFWTVPPPRRSWRPAETCGAPPAPGRRAMPDSFVWLDGKILPESETRLPLLTHGLHYGTGVFEGIRAYYDSSTGEVNLFRAKDHYERMGRNAKLLDLHLPCPADDLVDISA